jgi:purine-nucleoside phosphorylase
MEASAIFTIAKFRKVKAASIFVISDVLGKKGEKKFHRFDTKKGQRQIIDAAFDCLKSIKK